MSDVTDKIRTFITEELLFETPDVTLTDDTVLLEGMIDSLGLMQLVSYIEEEFGFQVSDADITSDNFRTVGNIEKIVLPHLA